MNLRFVEHPLYNDAHPNEDGGFEPHVRCPECAIAIRPDTNERVLLWRAGGSDWTLSRHDAEFDRHQDLRTMELRLEGLAD